ncbi:prolactin receptor b [Clarias gariepinus]|uniref:prolactin receptor b n=1 Tax=Clarias gariepinus TaxID=13013 RepID=UPI00234CC270|nr:prolactin receptor b [Clarias gariepinus]XP_053337164.1 prolactin receptor b [Clarias gariepinus]
MQSDTSRVLAAVFLLHWIPPRVCQSTPGQPKLTGCRSTDKETFSCWWEPGSTGGLTTTYRLFYRKEGSEKVYECPDYHRSGNNSCFFDKAHTSIWIFYSITVMAFNNYGNTSSEPVEVDVMDIVQPHSPGNMTLALMGVKDNPYFLVKWEAPHDIDTRSGWVTLSYEVRVKQEQVSDWEVYNVGKQKELSIFSPKPGGNYTIQVRCKLDQGLWSEWTPPVFIQMPNNSVFEKPFLIVIAVITTFVVLVLVGILTAKRKHVKHFLLPPVPGPKIKGFDGQLLKTVKVEDICNTVNFQGIFPVPECPDHVEYVVVLDSEENGENSGYKVHLERQGANQNMSEQKTWNELNIADHSDKQKFPVLAHNCQNSDPESTALNTPQHSNQYSTYDVPQQKPDISHENMASSSETSCTCNHEQNQVCVTPYGLMEQKPKEDCKQKLTIEKEEDYSKVSGIYSETVLVIQKDSSPLQRHKTMNNDPCKKTKIKDSTDPQEYVATLYDMF